MPGCHLLLGTGSPSRLAEQKGAEPASRFYQATRDATLELVRESGLPSTLLPPEAHPSAELFGRFHTGERSLIWVATDCLQMDAQLLLEAEEHLHRMPVVLGPEVAGDYYLLGFSVAALEQLEERNYPVFRDIHWGSPTVMAETLARLREMGLPFAALPVLSRLTSLEKILACPRGAELIRKIPGFGPGDSKLEPL